MKRNVVIILLMLGLVLPLGAKTLTVNDSGGADYLTIQAALDDADPGDTVLVFPGVYRERIEMADGVNLIGSGPASTVIDGEGKYDQVVSYVHSSEVLLSGFRITGSSNTASWTTCGVYANGPLTMTNNVINGNYGGIVLRKPGGQNLINNTIADNFNGVVVETGYKSKPRIAIVYANLTVAQQFQGFLEDKGYETGLFPMKFLFLADFSDYDIILLGPETGNMGEWGTTAGVNRIVESGCPVIGLNEGGYAFFGKLNLATGFPHGVHGQSTGFLVLDRNHDIFNLPHEILIPKTNILQIYHNNTSEVEIYFSKIPRGVRVLGRDATSENYYPLTLELNRYLLWGWNGPPDVMTAAGRSLFLNILEYLHRLVYRPPTAHVLMNNIIAGNTQTGIFHYGDPRDLRILYNDVWGNGSIDYFSNELAGSFVPQPGTGEISADPRFRDAVYHLEEGSPCIDAGHPGPAYNDPDGSRNDMGAYGGAAASGTGTHPGSGFIFTSIGNIPTSEIVQDPDDPAHGLANVDAATAADFSIPAYHDAPFGASLRIHGLFGDADIADGVRYYQILVGQWDGDNPPEPGDYTPLTDALYKVKYIPQPDGTILYEYHHLGAKEIKGVPNVYELTYEGWWSHIDLRVIWNTRSYADGKYTLTYRAFRDHPSNPDALQVMSLTPNDLDHLTLIVDNSPVEATIHAVKYDPANPNFDPGTDGEIPECGIINLLDNTENLRFVITAWHPNGYLRSWKLDALWGKNNYAGIIANAYYPGIVPPNNWHGVMETEFNSADAAGLAPWQRCAYQFRLRAYTRTTNGYGYLTHWPYAKEFSDHYFIDLGTPSCTRADIDLSGAVDMLDLQILADHWMETCAP